MQTLADFAAAWKDTPESHKAIHELFCELVNADPQLKAHRDFIEAGVWGFGERSFHFMWKLILNEMPKDWQALEIGVHRGQVLTLWRMLRQDGFIMGVSPFDGSETGEPRDYRKDVYQLCEHFGQPKANLMRAMSHDHYALKELGKLAPWNIIYIDGSHMKSAVLSDILNYAPMVVPGGYLVCDDSGHRLEMPWGFFRGHESVSAAVDELLPPFGPDTLPDGSRWRHLGSVVHNRIFQRIG